MAVARSGAAGRRSRSRVRVPKVLSPEEKALEHAIVMWKMQERKEALAYVAAVGRQYDAELERDDGFHKARLAKLERELVQAIKESLRWFGPGNVTAEDRKEFLERKALRERWLKAGDPE